MNRHPAATAHAASTPAQQAERLATLRVAALVLRERVAPIEVSLDVVQGPNVLAAVASWAAPGVVRVRFKSRGLLIVQSVPGRPGEPDEAATAAAQADALGGTAHVDCARLTRAEQLVALQIAAARLQDRARLPSASVRVKFGNRWVDALAVWHWPGVVRLTDKESGELLLQALPGRPFEEDTAALHAAPQW